MTHTDIKTVNGLIIRQLHSPDKKKDFGVLVLPEEYDGRDNSLVKSFDDVLSARLYTGDFTRKTIDNVNGVPIFKLILDGYDYGYAYMLNGNIVRCGSLTLARKNLGWIGSTAPAKLTAPKKSYPQNQPGYDPSRAR